MALPTTITLRLKVPPGHIEGTGTADEFTLGTDLQVATTRIGDIRERIQQVVPSNPAPERQRLLYAGRELADNEQTLADALNVRRDPTQTEFVIHLLLKGHGTATMPGRHSRNQSTSTGPSPASHSHTHGGQRLPRQERGQQLPPQDNLELAQLHLQAQQAQQAGLIALQQAQQAQHNARLRHLPPVGMYGLHPQYAAPLRHVMPQDPQQGFQPPPTDGRAYTGPTQLPGQHDQHQRSASQPPPRPQVQGVFLDGIGPNGERFQFQQHIQVGRQPMLPGVGLPHVPGNLAVGGFGQQRPAPRRSGPSAVEQARDNLVEMRRLLDLVRRLDDGATDEQRTLRIDQLQQCIQEVQNFVDPFNLGGSTAPAATALNELRAASGSQHIYAPRGTSIPQGIPMPRASSQPPPGQGNAHGLPSENQQTTASDSPAHVTAYLLSSPTGPQAILYSPQHGTYTGSMTPVARPPIRTTQPSSVNANGQPPANRVQAVAAPPAVAPAADAQPDNLGALGPLINHVWLLSRVLIFAYFILGANLGWRRPLAMLAIAVGFWLLRQGPLGEGGIFRRWWDGIVNQGQQRAVRGQQQGQAQARPGQMPTPAQVAQRLLDEDRQQRNHGLSRLREQLRPAERALALLVASLWPGVGEAYVRALEAEERRRNEEEVAARRREEEERQQREEEGKKKRAEEAATSTVEKSRRRSDSMRAHAGSSHTETD